MAQHRAPILCVDVGSTWTKAALVAADGSFRTAQRPTDAGRTDVALTLDRLRTDLDAPDAPWRACSSAGGGLRIAVVGFEREVTARAGSLVALSAGGSVVHVASGALDTDPEALAALAEARPDVLLLVGGTDGGNAAVLLRNAAALAGAEPLREVPVVVAGNREAAPTAAATLAAGGRTVTCVENVLPAIGTIEPAAARPAIRAAFLDHVIGGKHLTADPAVLAGVIGPTPDLVLIGVEVLARVAGCDVLVVDVGGATTDVYSVITPAGEDAEHVGDVVAPLWQARTVEADLGMRWSAATTLEAARREGLAVPDDLAAHARAAADHPSWVPTTDAAWALDLALGGLAARVAVRRHARPSVPGGQPRPLSEVGLLVGSGGVLRAEVARAGGSRSAVIDAVLAPVLADRAGGWVLPHAARPVVDGRYVLATAGMLERDHPDRAAALVRDVLGGVAQPV